jgi:ribosomal protein L32
MLEVANCPDCGKLYLRLAGRVCPQCQALRQQQLNNAIGLVKARPGLPLEEIGRLCGISENVLLEFAEEGTFRRLDLSVVYPCRFCSGPITSGTICAKCHDELARHIIDLRKRLEEHGPYRPIAVSGHFSTPYEPTHEEGGVSRKEALMAVLSERSKKRKSRRYGGIIR